jgi:hypothetical protein
VAFRKISNTNLDIILVTSATEFKSTHGHIDIRDYACHPIFLDTKRQVKELL